MGSGSFVSTKKFILLKQKELKKVISFGRSNYLAFSFYPKIPVNLRITR
jgi:hypothetical protein